MKLKSGGSVNRENPCRKQGERVVVLIRWFVIAAALYIAYYTFSYMIFVMKKEKNVLAGIFISLLAAAVAVLPFLIDLR